MTHKVLVVDDDADARSTLLCVLAPVAEVIAAADGSEALRLIAAEKPELALLDVSMPEMGGLELLESGLKLAPRMKVVMLTGQSDIAVAKAALDKGARAYITKPVDPQRLRDEIRDILESNERADDHARKMPWRVNAP